MPGCGCECESYGSLLRLVCAGEKNLASTYSREMVCFGDLVFNANCNKIEHISILLKYIH